MENLNLQGLLGSQLQEALEKAQKDFGQFISDVNTIAGQIGQAYRFGEVRAPGINAEKCLEKLPSGKAKVVAIGHYQGHAHATLTKVALNAARRMHRQKRDADAYAALQVAIDLLRFVVNSRADLARLEAAAAQGPFAFRKPQTEMFYQVEARLGAACEQLHADLQLCTKSSDIVLVRMQRSVAELATPQARVHEALNNAENRAREKNWIGRIEQVELCRVAVKEVEEAAQAADTASVTSVGAVVQTYYGIMNRFPWYFGMPKPAKKSVSVDPETAEKDSQES